MGQAGPRPGPIWTRDLLAIRVGIRWSPSVAQPHTLRKAKAICRILPPGVAESGPGTLLLHCHIALPGWARKLLLREENACTSSQPRPPTREPVCSTRILSIEAVIQAYSRAVRVDLPPSSPAPLSRLTVRAGTQRSTKKSQPRGRGTSRSRLRRPAPRPLAGRKSFDVGPLSI